MGAPSAAAEKPASCGLPAADQLWRRAGGENFPVTLPGVPAATRRHLRTVYGYARLIDELGDTVAGDRVALLAAVEAEVRAIHAGRHDGADHPVLRALARLCHENRPPLDPLLDLIAANRQDQHVARYRTYEELLGYCALSAAPVGRLVLHVVGADSPRRRVLSDRVCAALQLLEHWQDLAEDAARGRVYVPDEDLRSFSVRPDDLAAGPTPPRVRRLVAFETHRARALLDAGAPVVGTLSGTARVAVAGYVAGGRATAGALRAADYDVLARSVRPSRAATVVHAARAWAVGR